MLPFIAKTIFLTSNMFLPYSPDAIFPLLCPVREYEWIPEWKCDVIQTKSGVNEKGCIFRTDFEGYGGPEIWVTSEFEPGRHIQFVRTSPCLVTIYTIDLIPEKGGTSLAWDQTVTSLNEQGNLLIETHTEADYKWMIKSLETKLDTFLSKQGSAVKCAPSAN